MCFVVSAKWVIKLLIASLIFENDVLQVWQWDFVQKMLHQGFLPYECFDCKYKDSCRWGSRMDGNIYNWSYSAFDPLGDLENKQI